MLDLLKRQSSESIDSIDPSDPIRRQPPETPPDQAIRYRQLFEMRNEGFSIMELVRDASGQAIDLRYIDLNARFEALTGLSRNSVLGRLRSETFGTDVELLRTCQRVVDTGQPARFERYVEALGRHYDTSMFPWDGDRFASVYADITAAKQAAEALRRANAQLREEDRRKNEFLGVLSHELRNPLMPIKNSLYILDRAAPGSEVAQRARAIMARQVDQLARLVDDLLDVTRISRNKIQLQRRRLDLNELVRCVLEDHRTIFEARDQRVELVPAPGPVFIDADGNRMAQVVGNLLHNASKFTPPTGRVMVSVEIDRSAAQAQAIVRVGDTGVGLSPELAAHVFEPFVQADSSLDRSKGGLGLGLALVKGLVELHGGAVSAHSPGPGQGSQFTVRLPLRDAAPVSDEPVPVAAAGGRRRVLVIEDNPDAAESLRALIELHGHEVTVVNNGVDGIARARALRPDLVLCDIGLPGLDGFAVAGALRADATLRDTRLVAVSGYALPEDLQRAASAGFQGHLAKPPRVEQLVELLSQGSGVTR